MNWNASNWEQRKSRRALLARLNEKDADRLNRKPPEPKPDQQKPKAI